MKRTRETPQTWTVGEVTKQEHALEMRVSDAARELDRVKAIHRAELAALRKFRKAKITHAARIVPGPTAPSSPQGSGQS